MKVFNRVSLRVRMWYNHIMWETNGINHILKKKVLPYNKS